MRYGDESALRNSYLRLKRIQVCSPHPAPSVQRSGADLGSAERAGHSGGEAAILTQHPALLATGNDDLAAANQLRRIKAALRNVGALRRNQPVGGL